MCLCLCLCSLCQENCDKSEFSFVSREAREFRKGISAGPALKYFTRFIGAGGDAREARDKGILSLVTIVLRQRKRGEERETRGGGRLAAFEVRMGHVN